MNGSTNNTETTEVIEDTVGEPADFYAGVVSKISELIERDMHYLSPNDLSNILHLFKPSEVESLHRFILNSNNCDSITEGKARLLLNCIYRWTDPDFVPHIRIGEGFPEF